jgi:hypothetical protein
MRTVKSNRTLGRDVLRMLTSSGPISVSALIACCTGAFVSAAIMTRPVVSRDWMFCVEAAVYIGWAPGVIVAICGVSVTRQLAVRTVLVGGVISGLIAAWCLDQLFAAWAAI